MVDIDRVPLWTVDGGIGHAVVSRDSCWTMTACGTFGTFRNFTIARPARVCRKCRGAMRDAVLIPTLDDVGVDWRAD